MSFGYKKKSALDPAGPKLDAARRQFKFTGSTCECEQSEGAFFGVFLFYLFVSAECVRDGRGEAD